MYLIWSNQHKAWWRPVHNSYTSFIHEAGKYKREEALNICQFAAMGWPGHGPLPELPVRADDLAAFMNRWGS